MKKTICLFFLALYLLCMYACACENKTATAKFYYLEDSPQFYTNTAIIQPESRALSVPLSDLDSIVREYLRGPESNQFHSPFPSGTKLVSIQHGKELTEVVLSDEIAQLSGVDLTVACACLSATLLEFSQTEAVQIKAETASIGPQGTVIMDQQSIPFLG